MTMTAKTKRTQIALFVILLLGILAEPLSAARANARPAETVDDALILMVTSELWLTGGGEPVEPLGVGQSPGMMSYALPLPAKSARQVEVAIYAVKQVIAMKEAAYEQGTVMLQGKVSSETLENREAAHQSDLQKLNGSLEELRREWRREKRFLPKLAKPFKQAGGWFWHKIGPAGRSVLRAVGDELLQVVVVGDPVTGRVVRMLLIKHIRRVGMEKGKQLLVRILLRGQVDEEEGTEAEEGNQPGTAEEARDEELEHASFDEFWGNVFTDLSLNRRHCNADAVTYYRDCLQSAAGSDGEWTHALTSCQSMAEGLKPYPAGHVILEDKQFQFRDDDNYLRLEYDTASKQVLGRMEVIFKDYGSGGASPETPFCTITNIYDFSGTLDENACQMSGDGTMVMSWEGAEDPCAWTDMQTDQGTYPFSWSATIVRGVINGGTGDRGYHFILDFVEHRVSGD